MDKNLSSIMGAEDLSSIHEILFRYEQSQLPDQFTPEDTKGDRLLGGLYRLAKTVLFENIQDGLFTLVQHEVFGHGARLREFGYSDARFQFHLFPPFGTGVGDTYWSNLSLTNDQWASISIAGVESQRIAADELRMRALERGSINYREANLYFIGRIALTDYAAITTVKDLNANSENDIGAYINMVHSRNANVTLARIQTNSYLNLLDPFTIGWLYSYGYRYLHDAKVETVIPMIPLGAWKYLPGFRFSLTPFGYEYCLETLLADSGRVIEITTGAGSADNGVSESLDARTRNIATLGPVTIDGSFHAWRQPELYLGDPSNPISGPSTNWSIGALLAIETSVKFSRTAAITVTAGYKTRGYCDGETLDRGPLIRAGVLLGQ